MYDTIFNLLKTLFYQMFQVLNKVYIYRSTSKVTATVPEEFENTKGVIIIRISKNRQHNGQKKEYKRTNNDLQHIHIKLKIE
jgi:hypothetical protein